MKTNIEIIDKAVEALALDKFSSDSTKYVEFAFFLIERKIETDSVYILAGLQNDSYYEKVQYFNKVLAELEIDISSIGQLDRVYALSIARQVVNKEVDPIVAANKLERLYIQTDYDPFYIEFLEISDGIDLLNEGYELVPGMTKDNLTDYIFHAFELFIIYSDLQLPDKFWQQGYCKKCSQRVTPIKKEKSNGFFKKKSEILCCPNCGMQQFFWTRYNAGQDLYLKEIRLTTASS